MISGAEGPGTVFPYPIVLLAFNRPAYLEDVLASLHDQTIGIDQSRVVIHRDGYLGSADEKRGRIDQTPAVDGLLRRSLPDATFLQSSANLGIARAYDLVERCAFEQERSTWVLFLEDDLVLQPTYLESLARVIEEAEPFGDVAAASACGDTFVPKARGELAYYPMHFAWGCAVRRSHWVESRQLLDVYLESLAAVQYSDRDHDAVYAALAQHGVLPAWSAQDAVKEAIRRRMGRFAITTGANYGRYVGVVGELFTPLMYEARDYEGRELAAAPWTVPLTVAELDRVRDESEIAFAVRAARNLVAGRTAERLRIKRQLDRIERLKSRLADVPHRGERRAR